VGSATKKRGRTKVTDELHRKLILAAATELGLLVLNGDCALASDSAAESYRLASKQSYMRRRWAAAPEPSASRGEPVRYWSPAELADVLSLSVDTVRRLFEREPGVLVIGSDRYRTLRIPQEVVDRVRRKREVVC
jgi:hypothetical protein